MMKQVAFMNLQLEPALKYSMIELSDLFNNSYAGYVVPVSFTPSILAKGFRLHGIDLGTSQIVVEDGKGVGIALLAHRGWTTRLAAMAIVPEFRHKGIGRWLMETILQQGHQRGDRVWTLEVIEENKSALQLYQRAGFKAHRRLIGFQCDNPQGKTCASLEEVDVREVAQILLQYGTDDLPWQVSGETLSQLGPPACGFRLSEAFAAIEKQDNRIELLSVVVLPQTRRQGQATRLLKGLFSKYPNCHWRIPARFPEEIAPGLFENLGFERDRISQQQMFLTVEKAGQ